MNELKIRSAALEPSTFDAENRTVSVLFASNAPVRRMDLDGAYEKRLDMSQTAVDLSELIGGPVLNSPQPFRSERGVGCGGVRRG
jgi:hypothetical protein